MSLGCCHSERISNFPVPAGPGRHLPPRGYDSHPVLGIKHGFGGRGTLSLQG